MSNIIRKYVTCVGCGKLFSIDGNWKLRYPICMFKVPKEVTGFHGALEYVDSCPHQPVPQMAFCREHCKLANEKYSLHTS